MVVSEQRKDLAESRAPWGSSQPCLSLLQRSQCLQGHGETHRHRRTPPTGILGPPPALVTKPVVCPMMALEGLSP